MVKANNPQMMVNQTLSQNPQVNELIKRYGDPKTAFYSIAEQQGIDPNEIINMLK